MNIQSTTISLFFLVLLQACTTMPDREVAQENEPVGANIEELYRSWGVPRSRTELPNSSRALYIWELDGCRANVTADENGEILGYAMTGNCNAATED